MVQGKENIVEEKGLEGEACSKLFEVAKDYLLKLSHCTSFISDLNSGEIESKDFLGSSFALLRELGRLSQKEREIEEIALAYNSKLLKLKELKELDDLLDRKYSGEREWIDELNYIYVWALNTYSLNLKTVSLAEVEKKYSGGTIEVEVRDDRLRGEVDDQRARREKEWFKNGTFIYRNLFSRAGFKVNGNERYSFEDIINKTQALERLEREIRSGRIYIYLSRPAKNPKLKRYLNYLFLEGLVLSLATFLKFFVSNVAISGNGQSKSAEPILFSIMSFIFFWLSRKENNRHLENENFKYSFSRKIFYYFFFLSAFFIIPSSNSFSAFHFDKSDNDKTASSVLLVLLVSLVIVSFTAYAIFFFFFNPKVDKVLREELLRKYSNAPYLK